MKNKKVLAIMVFITILFQVLSYFPQILDEDNSFLYTVSFSLFNIFWLLNIFNNSLIKKTIYWKIIMISLACFIIGLLFKLEHWSSAGTIIISSLLIICITYFVWFIKKKTKSILDYLKLLYIELTAFFMFAILQHYKAIDYQHIQSILFIFLVLFYYKKIIEEKEINLY